ncbi:hypothetical protein [Sediminibacterium sp.]|uniref:hypothetical protein n=1 Tax=Sediminibacterium sp. TaxID=1917865 RepID=UPI002731F3F4|nr:hypothetical protein [Sediminibacterium sp.]MDP2421551.1 hypothetical protein [Sediminibacterium sp.]
MRPLILFLFVIGCIGCGKSLVLNKTNSNFVPVTGEQFFKDAMTMQWKQRDSFAVKEILAGNIPRFLLKLIPINVIAIDSTTGKVNRATFYVMPDYLSVGTNKNWARIPLTPIAAQLIADSLQCFLPTRKMVNDIYANAAIRLTPVPMYIHRDSTVTMWQHHLIIEGQRKQQKGLIAGIKKDVVISDQLTRSAKTNRVAIYGWHLPDGKPIQPLYTGHVNWYADYSHGIRLIYRKIKVNGNWMDYAKVMEHPILRKLLSDEPVGDVIRY